MKISLISLTLLVVASKYSDASQSVSPSVSPVASSEDETWFTYKSDIPSHRPSNVPTGKELADASQVRHLAGEIPEVPVPLDESDDSP